VETFSNQFHLANLTCGKMLHALMSNVCVIDSMPETAFGCCKQQAISSDYRASSEMKVERSAAKAQTPSFTAHV